MTNSKKVKKSSGFAIYDVEIKLGGRAESPEAGDMVRMSIFKTCTIPEILVYEKINGNDRIIQINETRKTRSITSEKLLREISMKTSRSMEYLESVFPDFFNQKDEDLPKNLPLRLKNKVKERQKPVQADFLGKETYDDAPIVIEDEDDEEDDFDSVDDDSNETESYLEIDPNDAISQDETDEQIEPTFGTEQGPKKARGRPKAT